MMEKSTGKRSGLCLQPSVSQGEAKRPNVAAANREKALAALKSTYGYTGFRGKQEEAILAVMSGRRDGWRVEGKPFAATYTRPL